MPFVNAKPLVVPFEREGSPVEVVYAWPSKLPALLEAGEVQAILCSSFDALTVPNRTAAAGVCIGSRGPADSVRLFSKVPFETIGSLALDASSMTSNALAQIILKETFRYSPRVEVCNPDLESMLESHDAAVLIGDKGMQSKSDGLNVLDLGQAWLDLTGLPFVWALWIGKDGLDEILVGYLNDALEAFWQNPSPVIVSSSEAAGWPRDVCHLYLTATMNYRLAEHDLEGLRKFGELILRHGLASTSSFPRFVNAAVPSTAN